MDELMIKADITDKAETLRAAAAELAKEYAAEGDKITARKIETLIGGLPDDSAARLLDILQKCFRQ